MLALLGKSSVFIRLYLVANPGISKRNEKAVHSRLPSLIKILIHSGIQLYNVSLSVTITASTRRPLSNLDPPKS